MDPLREAIKTIIKENFNELVDLRKLNEVIDAKCQGLEGSLREFVRQESDEINKSIASLNTTTNKQIEIKIRDKNNTVVDDITVEAQHKEFKNLLQFLRVGLNPYIYGPTGSGKTKVIFLIFKEILKKPLYSTTLYPQMPVSQIMGYNDASGRYIEGVAYKPYKDGGALLANEMDNGSSASNSVFNQLSDDECFFPCGIVKRHPDFQLIATANTLGNGANRQYVGRSPQDKALLNRFVYLHWGYDYALEKRLALKEFLEWGGKDTKQCVKLMKDLWCIRQAIDELNIDHIVSMRNIMQQSRLLADGADLKLITKSVVGRGLDIDQFRKIVAKAQTIQLPDEAKIVLAGNENFGYKVVDDNPKQLPAPPSTIDVEVEDVKAPF